MTTFAIYSYRDQGLLDQSLWELDVTSGLWKLGSLKLAESNQADNVKPMWTIGSIISN